jgi:hypothetical protein
MRSIGSLAADIVAGAAAIRRAPKVYCDLVAAQIRRSLLEGDHIIEEARGLKVDQLQSNGLYGAKQLRVTLPDGMGTYRVLVLAADTPVSIGGVPADEHFNEPLIERQQAAE